MHNQDIVRAYSIQEVSQLLNIPTGTIRQWEKDLHDLLIIPRTKQGARYYTDREIDILQTIQKLRVQNVGKGMIRTLLERYINNSTPATDNEPIEVVDLMVPPSSTSDNNTQALQAISFELQHLKEDVVNEVKREIAYQRQLLLDEIKHQVAHTSLQTVSEISKSIQRSNDKRKADVQMITDTILSNNKQTSESINEVVSSISTYATSQTGVIKKELTGIKEELRLENDQLRANMGQSLADIKNDVRTFAYSLHEDQQHLRSSVLELREYSKDILAREDGFQELVSTFREAAAAKQPKKNWWKWWN